MQKNLKQQAPDCAYLHIVADNGGEYPLHRFIVERHDADDIEVTEESRRDGVTTSTWWTHGSQELNVNQTDLSGVLLVIPGFKKKIKKMSGSSFTA